jgi:hypothetical protein
MGQAAYCIATTVTQASQLIAELRRRGIADDDVSVLYSDTGSSRDFVHAPSTKAPEGAAAGAGAGGVLGAAVGWLAGVGGLSLPGLASLVAAGPILGALSGIGLGAALGGLAGALVGYGIPEFEAKRYEGKVVGGGILISVHVASRQIRGRVLEVFAAHGGEDVAIGEEARADFPVLERRSA